MKRRFCAYLIAVASMWTACSKSVTTPTPAPPGPVQLTHLSITGNSSLTAVGETSQLTAAATFSDGAVKDVSSDTSWVSIRPFGGDGLVRGCSPSYGWARVSFTLTIRLRPGTYR